MVPFFFEAALSVKLTTMLVMTTIFISKACILLARPLSLTQQ